MNTNASSVPLTNVRFKTLHTSLPNILWVWRMAWIDHAYYLIGFLIATLLKSLLPAASVLTGRELINTLVTALQSGSSNLATLLPWLLLGAALAISQSLVSNLGDYWQYSLQDELDLHAGSIALNQAARLDLVFWQSNEARDALERARKYGSGVVTQVLFSFVTVVSQSIRFCSLVGILLWIEPLVVGWLCLLAIPYGLFKWKLAERSYTIHHRRANTLRQNAYYSNLLTNFDWLPEVKFLGLAPLFIERFEILNRDFIITDRQLRRLFLFSNISFAAVSALTLYAFFGRIAKRVLDGVLTIGDVTIYIGTVMQLQGVVQSLVQAIALLHEQLLHLADLRAFLDLTPSFPSHAGYRKAGGNAAATRCAGQDALSPYSLSMHPPLPNIGTSMIEFDNVSFIYPNNDRPALTNLSFYLQPGETVAVVGENGAGKSTLAFLLARLYEPTTGSIRIGGVDLRTIEPMYWQQQIGFVFQKFLSYETTVRENIAFGNWPYLNEHPAEVEAIARLAQADHLIEGLLQGYESVLGWQFAQQNLSLGQWQKLALARGLARSHARLLILDEPSASLDARAEYELFNQFRQVAAGRTTLLISHRFSTISMADRILVLEKGRLTECGTHQALLAQGGHYATLYQLHRQQMSE